MTDFDEWHGHDPVPYHPPGFEPSSEPPPYIEPTPSGKPDDQGMKYALWAFAVLAAFALAYTYAPAIIGVALIIAVPSAFAFGVYLTRDSRESR